MEILIILLLILLVEGNKTECDRLKLGGRFYDREVLLSDVGKPNNLIVHKATNTVFFSYSTPESFSDVDFQLAFYNIDTGENRTIAGITGGCTVAVDNDLDEVYVGGNDGIYKFNMKTQIADFYKAEGKNIWSLFFKRHLFYISYPDQKLHFEIDGHFALIKEFVNFQIDHFYVTSTDEIFFANQSGLFKYDTVLMKAIVINEMMNVRQIVEDNEGNVYVCSNIGLFIDTKTDGFKKVLQHRNIFGLSFDRENNFIISDTISLLKLKLSNGICDDLNWR